MQFEELTDIALIQWIVKNPRDEAAWTDFMRRFDKLISLWLLQACKRYDYKNGKVLLIQQELDDLKYTLYAKFLVKQCAALSRIRGEHAGSVHAFFKTACRNHVINEKMKNDLPGKTSLDTGKKDDEGERRPIEPADRDDLERRRFQECKEYLIKCIRERTKNPTQAKRNLIFFEKWLQGYTAREIFEDESSNPGLSQARIGNILTEIKQMCGDCLNDEV